jgi:hypothetical protein
VKRKAVLGVLALIGTLALSATAAQAGQGGLPSALTSFFACYSINGKDSGQTVDLQNADESPIAVPNRVGVQVNNGSLACTIVRMLVPSNAQSPNLAEPNPTQESSFNAMKCYSVTTPKGTLFSGPAGRFNFTDTIWGTLGTQVIPGSPSASDGSLATETGLTISQLRYICGPAIIGQ